MKFIEALAMRAEPERWPLVSPLKNPGYTFEFIDIILVTLQKDGHVGRGEATGVYYRKDDATSILKQVEQFRQTIEAGIGRDALLWVLPPSGARNALDCAWERTSGGSLPTGRCRRRSRRRSISAATEL